VRIVVVCVGRLRGGPFEDDLAHYRRLLERHVRLEVREVKEAGGDLRRKGELLRLEADAILSRIEKPSFVCALDREGEALSSIAFSAWLEERRQSGQDLSFVVGGPLGLDRRITEQAQALISFGPMTLPHQLARVVLLEQLFRAHKILAGEPYHY
jgi:23S rRNA (pseudouridine1915-N3)-methyltransferase